MNKYNYGKQPKDNANEYWKKVNYQSTIEHIKAICKQNVIRHGLCIMFIFLLLAWVFAIYMFYTPPIKDGHLRRTYDQIMLCLKKDPADISVSVYKSEIPKLIQHDIERLLASDGDFDIIYSNKCGENQIVISKNTDSKNGFNVDVIKDDYYPYPLTDNISFYEDEGNIVVYGTEGYRCIWRYEIEDKYVSGFSKDLQSEYIDLFGTNLECDMVRTFCRDMTLVIKDKQFMFYQLGRQVGETFEFPGADIINLNYYYILDSNNDMYYMYYCLDSDKPWVKFNKVAENIDEVTEQTIKAAEDEDSYGMEFWVYLKDGVEYVAISDLKTEREYGQNYGKNEVSEENYEPNFEVITIPMSELVNKNTILYLDDYGMAWRKRILYPIENGIVYLDERLNGLDMKLTDSIPEEKLAAFDGIEVTPYELKETIQKLKMLYQTYE